MKQGVGNNYMSVKIEHILKSVLTKLFPQNKIKLSRSRYKIIMKIKISSL